MKSQDRIDLYQQHKADYAATRKPALVKLKKATYLAITGQGEPGGAAFTEKLGALYAAAFTVKMTRKFAGRGDYAIGKLEAQWWAGDGDGDGSRAPKEQWQWRLLIRTPDFVTQRDLQDATTKLLKKGKSPSVREVRLESVTEGLCVQILHVGPYDRECESIALMKAFAAQRGLTFRGRHHEIYLSDPRRVAPEKLKTILRMPVTASGAK